jgi:hypothetical protein
MNLVELQEYCLRWLRAYKEYEDALISGSPAQKIFEAHLCEDRLRIAFEEMFHRQPGRWPHPSEYRTGTLTLEEPALVF